MQSFVSPPVRLSTLDAALDRTAAAGPSQAEASLPNGNALQLHGPDSEDLEDIGGIMAPGTPNILTIAGLWLAISCIHLAKISQSGSLQWHCWHREEPIGLQGLQILLQLTLEKMGLAFKDAVPLRVISRFSRYTFQGEPTLVKSASTCLMRIPAKRASCLSRVGFS